MEFNKKVYHSQVFRDCAIYFDDNEQRKDSIKRILFFGAKFLSPIENYLESNKSQLDSERLIYKIRDSLENNYEYSNLSIYKSLNKKIYSYINRRNKKFTKKPLEYYSWVLDDIVNQINKSEEWDEIIDRILSNDKINENQVFLSYSSIDKSLSFWMYQYFRERNVFLYVDWMFGKYYDSGIDSKNKLEHELLNID